MPATTTIDSPQPAPMTPSTSAPAWALGAAGVMQTVDLVLTSWAMIATGFCEQNPLALWIVRTTDSITALARLQDRDGGHSAIDAVRAALDPRRAHWRMGGPWPSPSG